MKKIEAVIRPEKLGPVKDALEAKGIIGLTITQVRGHGRQKGITLQWRAGEYRVDLLSKIKLEIVIRDAECQMAVDTICDAARTGKEGDGMIFVESVENAIRVRTGDCGERCLDIK
jgi:nitrogen regulatory protein P-II 1